MKKKNNPLLGIFFGLMCLLAATALALALLHISDLLYRISVDVLDIPESTGYSREVIMRNYHDVMRYLSPFNNTDFQLTDLRFSEDGALHFEDVKNIFSGIYIAGLVSAAGIAVTLLLKRKKDKAFLRVSAITTVVLPVLIACAVAVDFDTMFVLFHKIFFAHDETDSWIFDRRIDPVIDILPQDFFMYCALFIVFMWLAAAAVQYIFHRRGARKAKKS
jgi:integral membrane protein TIGR01906